MGESTSELRRDIEQIRSEIDRDLDALGDRVSPRRIYERRSVRMRRRLHSMKDAVIGPAERAMSSAGDGAHRMGDAASGITDVPDMVTDRTRGNPLMAGFVAFGIGVLLGSLPPATDMEREVAGSVAERLEPLKQRAMESAQHVGDEVRTAAGEATKSLQEDARTAADEVTSQAQTSSQELRKEAGDSSHRA